MASFEKISKIGVRQVYKKDDIVCIQGEPGLHMYIVLSGCFFVYINSLTDFPIKVAEILPGQFFGEMAVLDDAPRSATIISGGDSMVISISKDDFKLLITEDSEIALSIMRTLTGRIRSLNENLEKVRHSYNKADFTDFDFDDEKKQGKIAIMPEGAKRYDILKPSEYDYFTEARSIKCPVCAHEFLEKVPVFSKLAQKDAHIENDLRIKYSNFDPLWYATIVCVNCNYANYYTAFSRISAEAIERLKKSRFEQVVEKFIGRTNSINSVLESYYLVLRCNRMGEKSPEIEAKTWLRLYWLYGDANDEEGKTKAAENALSGYTKIAPGMDDYNKSQAYMIMAELSFSLDDLLKAAAYYEQVLFYTKKTNAVLHKRASTRLDEIVACMEEKQKEEEREHERKS